MKALLSGFLILLTFGLHAQTYTIETVPNPRRANGTFVSNPDHILSDASVASMNVMISDLEKTNGTQVAVVALNSIGDRDIFEFAQELFVKWGIGERGKDNGLLILLVLDQRTVRFHTGFGLEASLPDAICKRIQRDYMVPSFRDGDYSHGMLEGVRGTLPYLTDATLAAASISNETDTAGSDIVVIGGFYFVIALIVGLIRFATRRNAVHSTLDNSRSMKAWWFWFLLLPSLVAISGVLSESYGVYFFAMYGIFALSVLDKQRTLMSILKTEEKDRDYRKLHDYLKSRRAYWAFMACLFPIPGVFALIWTRLRQKHYRNHPRTCKKCGAPAERLSEKNEDVFLSAQQQLEEDLRSVDYDVWKCTQCDQFTIETFENPKSKYEHCPRCKTKSYYLSGSVTTLSATYSASGLREETYSCKNCSHTHVEEVVIPMLVASSGSSSDSSSDSGSSSSDFGGGDSGGGGASSSW